MPIKYKVPKLIRIDIGGGENKKGGKKIKKRVILPIPCSANISTNSNCKAPKKNVDRTIRPKRVPYINPYVSQKKRG